MPEETTITQEEISAEAVQAEGAIVNTEEYNPDRVTEIKHDYASALNDIDSKFAELSDSITDIESGIASAIATNKETGDAAYAGLVSEMNVQLTNIRNAQNMQVTQSASQLDSMMASGQFGGNVYRSQQVYSMNMSNIIATSMRVVSDITLQYRTAAEQLNAEYSSQQLSAYITGASTVLGAMGDLSKTYAMVHSELTVKKNEQLNDLYSLKAKIESAELITEMNNDAQKLMTQWNNDAMLQATYAKIDLEDRRIDMQMSISQMQDRTQRWLGQLGIEASQQTAAAGLAEGARQFNSTLSFQREQLSFSSGSDGMSAFQTQLIQIVQEA